MAKVSRAHAPELIIIGGSAGALDVLFRLLPKLKRSFSIPIVIVLHRKGGDDGGLAGLLAGRSHFSVKEVEDKDALLRHKIFLAPGDYHLLFESDGTLSLDDSEKVAYSRPSIDVSFQSAAETYGAAVTAILLSGANSDGTAGLIAVKAYGGITVSQTPESAGMPLMPQQAIAAGAVDIVLDEDGIAGFLNAF